jgi:hypothetical protein
MDTPQDQTEWDQTLRAVRRRQWARPIPKVAGRWLGQIIARRGLAAERGAAELESAWRQVVGPSMAAQTRVVGVRRGACEILVAHSALMQQISFQQRVWLQELQAHAPHFGIQLFRFRVGPVA